MMDARGHELRDETPGEDPEYWDALDKRCAVEIAKATLAKIHADKLQQRYGHIVTNAEFSIPVGSDTDKTKLKDMVRRLQRG